MVKSSHGKLKMHELEDVTAKRWVTKQLYFKRKTKSYKSKQITEVGIACGSIRVSRSDVFPQMKSKADETEIVVLW